MTDDIVARLRSIGNAMGAFGSIERKAADEIERLRAALRLFAEAATIFEKEYGHLIKPETGCNIKFQALLDARDALAEQEEKL